MTKKRTSGRNIFWARSKEVAGDKARTSLKERGYTYNRKEKVWIRGGFFNIEERKITYMQDGPKSWMAFTIKAAREARNII